VGQDVLLVKIYVQNALLETHALAANRICIENYREDNVNVKMVILMIHLQLHARNVFINVKLVQMEFHANLVKVLIDFPQINSVIVK
jgi:DNA-binding TFAR19-related protein (PDSD5 family)